MTDALVLSPACAGGDHHLCRPDRDRCDCDALRCATTHVLNVASSTSSRTSPQPVPSDGVDDGAVEVDTFNELGSSSSTPASTAPPNGWAACHGLPADVARSSSITRSAAVGESGESAERPWAPSTSVSVDSEDDGRSTSQQRDEAGAATPAHVEERGRLHDRRTENAMPVNVLLEDEVAPGFTGRDPDCIRYLEDPHHVCHNRDGQPVRVGQACWTDARSQVLRRDDEPMCGNCYGTGLLPMPGGRRGAVRCGCRAGRVRHAS